MVVQAMLEAGCKPSSISKACKNIRAGYTGAVIPKPARDVMTSPAYKQAAAINLSEDVVLRSYIDRVNRTAGRIRLMAFRDHAGILEPNYR